MFLALLIAADAPEGATPEPILSRVFPPGAVVGGVETWVVRGRNLARVESLVVEGGGVASRVVERAEGLLRVVVTPKPGTPPGYRRVRLEGPDGVSNPRLIRIDQVRQVVEVEPNDRPENAARLATETACAGVLENRDVDCFRFTARPGQVLTVEVEARRLGSPIDPVLSILTDSGRALAQALPSPNLDGDCRLAFSVPGAGDYLVRLHDRLYQGSDRSIYRLRITAQPFATGLFPLGGTPGATVRVAASGGTLPEALEQSVALGNEPGSVLAIPPFEGGVLAPGRLIVGDTGARERNEPNSEPNMPAVMTLGEVMNGRLDAPGEVDRYRLSVRGGEAVRLWVEAARAGSTLDGVLTVRDEAGKLLGESDDRASPFASRRVALGLPPHDSDPALTLIPERAGTWSIELTDRFDRGGPGFSYRLQVGAVSPRLAIEVVASADEPAGDSGRFGRLAPSALNLRPGAWASIPFSVAAEGRTGPITVRVEGLPEGVRADPVVVPISRPARAGQVAMAVEGAIVVRADASARRGSGEARLVASARPAEGPALRQAGESRLVFAAVPGLPASRPVVVRGGGIPISVVEADRNVGR